MKKPDRQPERRMSTALEKPEEKPDLTCPPPNRARLEMDVAARLDRATLKKAVVHNSDVTFKISTTLE